MPPATASTATGEPTNHLDCRLGDTSHSRLPSTVVAITQSLLPEPASPAGPSDSVSTGIRFEPSPAGCPSQAARPGAGNDRKHSTPGQAELEWVRQRRQGREAKSKTPAALRNCGRGSKAQRGSLDPISDSAPLGDTGSSGTLSDRGTRRPRSRQPSLGVPRAAIVGVISSRQVVQNPHTCSKDSQDSKHQSAGTVRSASIEPDSLGRQQTGAGLSNRLSRWVSNPIARSS